LYTCCNVFDSFQHFTSVICVLRSNIALIAINSNGNAIGTINPNINRIAFIYVGGDVVSFTFHNVLNDTYERLVAMPTDSNIAIMFNGPFVPQRNKYWL
jgi:hypothetical protein